MTKILDVFFFHLCPLLKKNYRRILATKNGTILSASIQSGFQILQEMMTRMSANKYQPRDLKFMLMMRIKPPQSQQTFHSSPASKAREIVHAGAHWKHWLPLGTQIKLFSSKRSERYKSPRKNYGVGNSNVLKRIDHLD